MLTQVHARSEVPGGRTTKAVRESRWLLTTVLQTANVWMLYLGIFFSTSLWKKEKGKSFGLNASMMKSDGFVESTVSQFKQQYRSNLIGKNAAQGLLPPLLNLIRNSCK